MKALFCLTFDKEFDGYLRKLTKHLISKTEVKSLPNKGIPPHMTMWGGLEMNCSTWRSRLERAAVMLRPFHGEIPDIFSIEAIPMPMGFYGLRLKFSSNFVMTGNTELNRKMCDFVGGVNFHLDQVRHVTLVTVKQEAIHAGREGKVLDSCSQITTDYLRNDPPNLSWIRMTPKIFIKFSTWGSWQEMPLGFLRQYGIDWSTGSFEVCEPEI